MQLLALAGQVENAGSGTHYQLQKGSGKTAWLHIHIGISNAAEECPTHTCQPHIGVKECHDHSSSPATTKVQSSVTTAQIC